MYSANTASRVLFKESSEKLGKENLSNGTDDSDIIECSILVDEKENRLRGKKIYGKNLQHAFTNKREVQLKNSKRLNNCDSSEIYSSIRLNLKKNFKLIDEEEALFHEKNNVPIKSSQNTPSAIKIHDSSDIINKVRTSIQKMSIESPHLSKTKLKNIERWLQFNDVETVKTPPFSNLSITPVNSTKKRMFRKCKERNKVCANSSIDSDVEDVLKAVYGNEWMQKNMNVKCKTEPKRRLYKNTSPSKSTKKNIGSARTILKSRENNNSDYDEKKNLSLNDSVISGVDLINLDDSSESLNLIKRNRLRKTDKKQDYDSETSSIELMNLPSLKKKLSNNVALVSNIKIPPVSLSNTGSKASENCGKTPKRTFLASLSVSTPTSRCHPDAKYYKVNFKSKKEELTKKLYKLYNSEIFGNQLADDMNFSWNIKLRGTAGYCYNKRLTKSTGEVLRLSRIEFSTKVVDRADRLRDTMIHELCHAASWVIDGVLDGHGAVWNSWAMKAMKRFPELPLIKRCHNYDVVTKYIYRCMSCGYSIKRQSKSINTTKKRCGHCYGVLELLLNKKKRGKTEVPEFDTTRTLRTPNKFAMFVKENYQNVKSTTKNLKHAEVMKILSQRYALIKNELK